MNLEEAREQALIRLKTERRKATAYEQALVAALGIRYAVDSEIIWRQLKYDLCTYPLYDAIAMWLDEESGLAAAVPEMMAHVAGLFLEVGNGNG